MLRKQMTLKEILVDRESVLLADTVISHKDFITSVAPYLIEKNGTYSIDPSHLSELVEPDKLHFKTDTIDLVDVVNSWATPIKWELFGFRGLFNLNSTYLTTWLTELATIKQLQLFQLRLGGDEMGLHIDRLLKCLNTLS